MPFQPTTPSGVGLFGSGLPDGGFGLFDRCFRIGNGDGCRWGFGDGALVEDAFALQEADDGVGRLGADSHPVLHLVGVDDDGGGIGEGVVMAYLLDDGAIPRRADIGYHDAVTGLLLLANTA